MRKLTIMLGMSAMFLAACGGSSTSLKTGSTSGTGSTGGTGTTTTTATVAVAALTLTTSTPSIASDGSTTATITALVRDASNNLIAGVPVTFSASSGGVAVTQATSDTSGSALATLSTAGDSSLRAITVTAKAGGQSATVVVQVAAGSTSTTVQMGSPAGAAFVASALGFSSTSLSAGGSTSVTVALQQSDGTLYSQPASITFNSTCASQGLATITSPVTTSTGGATATYVAKGCNGSDAITATTTIGTTALSATGKVTVAAPTIGSIVYKSATYTIISLKGSGSAAHPETSTVVFQVLDQSGGPSPGASVGFSLDTSVGGISVNKGPVTSDANGNVQTTVQAGTVATPVRVTATVLNTTPTISTQSNQLSVSTGVPTQNSFSLAVACHNVEAFNTDGVTVKVTARLADRFSNPVADGTAIQFNSEGGQIQPQCTTATTTNADGSTLSGVCTVDWVSSNPRPTVGLGGRAGRSTIFASAIGEESFVDKNGNGAFDNGETFTDLPERFRDDNGNGVHDAGEYFYDFNNDGVYNPADGIFNGVLCFDTTGRCDSTKSSTGIGTDNLIIMSGSTPDGLIPNPTRGPALGTASIAAGGAQYAFTVADVNGNPMASGTTITATVTGKGISMATGAPSSFTYPCTTEPVTYAFSIAIDNTTAINGETATLILDIKSAGGVETFASYPIPIGP